MALQPPVCQGLLINGASRSHSDTPHSVGLLWTSDFYHNRKKIQIPVYIRQIYFLSPQQGATFITIEPLQSNSNIRDQNTPMGGEIFRTRPDWPQSPRSVLYSWYPVSFWGVKRPGRDVEYQPPSRTEVK
jgi:hypothetical protein